MNDLPTVVNRHHYRKGALPRPWLYIGRGTPLGNPFKVPRGNALPSDGEAPRGTALGQYRRWLHDKIRAQDPGVLAELRRITPAHHLVCSCKPRPCHGDIVVRAWAWLRQQDANPQTSPKSQEPSR